MNSSWKINTIINSKSLTDRRQQIIDSLLSIRGLNNKKLQLEFFKPLPPQQLQPLNLAQLKKTKKRLDQAIKNQQLIYIYGDYDADGVSATTILWETLFALKANVLPYIPTRNDQTRGLSQKGIDEIIQSAPGRPSLIITVDNGITAFKACNYAKKLGIDIIITDHHQPEKKLPSAFSLLHSTDLAGAGVAWFLAFYLHKKAIQSLDIAALGTIADMVPLLHFNRSLAKFGLAKLRQSSRPGLKALARLAGLDLSSLQAHQVGYSLSPRLNAMARLEHALDSVRLLCTKDQKRAKALATTLNQTNINRQLLTKTMIAHAQDQLDSSQKLIFVASPSYHQGIVGLVAGRLVEQFHRPAVVVAIGKNYSKASGRSIAAFNLVQAFRSISPLLSNLGGHKLAAGFTCPTANLDKIKHQLEQLTQTSLNRLDLQPVVNIDCQISFNDINQALFKSLTEFQPFGMANPNPVFASLKVELVSVRSVGQDQKHLKLYLRQNRKEFPAIAFNLGHLANSLSAGQLLNLAYTLNENTWNHQTSLQLNIKDIQLN